LVSFFEEFYHITLSLVSNIPKKGLLRVWNLKPSTAIIAAALGVFASGIPVARALVVDSTDITIGVPNTGLSGFAGPFANLHIDLTSSTTAIVTFTSLAHGGYLYLLGGQGAADLNVNGPYSLGPVIETNAISGFGASFDANVPGNVSSFGKFDLSLNNSDGFRDSATSISFTLTDTGAPWSSAVGVLTPDDAGFLAAVHAFACAEPGCSRDSGAAVSGFAGNSNAPPDKIPEPATFAVLGTALVGFGIVRRRTRLTC
jgi:PEP-CTERM motif